MLWKLMRLFDGAERNDLNPENIEEYILFRVSLFVHVPSFS
jgi:hypothetical protein